MTQTDRLRHRYFEHSSLTLISTTDDITTSDLEGRVMSRNFSDFAAEFYNSLRNPRRHCRHSGEVTGTPKTTAAAFDDYMPTI